jgi:mRNA interferase MazF
MTRARRGEVWQVDFGFTAKVRPALLLTDETDDDNELDVVTLVLHTTALRGNAWEVNIPKPFLKPGAFHCQQVQAVSAAKLLRRFGALTPDELAKVEAVLALRLGL